LIKFKEKLVHNANGHMLNFSPKITLGIHAYKRYAKKIN